MFQTKLLQSTFILFLTLLMTACSGSADQENTEMDSSADMNMESSDMTGEDAMNMAPEAKLNLNTTPEEDFAELPGVGERMAYEFQEYRPYVSIAEFRQRMSRYVEDEQIAAYEELVFVPIDPNNSDMATLMQIPGLSEEEAQSLIDARPFDNNEAFIQTLSEYVNEEELATGQSYLIEE